MAITSPNSDVTLRTTVSELEAVFHYEVILGETRFYLRLHRELNVPTKYRVYHMGPTKCPAGTKPTHNLTAITDADEINHVVNCFFDHLEKTAPNHEHIRYREYYKHVQDTGE
jgi:hypothetical protein